MTLAEFIGAIAGLSGLLFVVTSMLAMGAALTMTMILQPLKNTKLVILALVANFILVPALAYVITLVLPISDDQKIALIVLGCRPARRSCPSWPRTPKATSASASG